MRRTQYDRLSRQQLGFIYFIVGIHLYKLVWDL